MTKFLLKALSLGVRAKRSGAYIIMLLLLVCASCEKDGFTENKENSLLSKNSMNVKGRSILSLKSADLSLRLGNLKREFYLRKLDAKFAPKDDKGIIWEPEWAVPRIQTVNDTVSYVLYRLKPSVIRNGKIVEAREVGAATYLMVKNEKEFYKAFYYLPSNLRSKEPSNDIVEFEKGKFTGKLLLSNLESKQSYLLDYKEGVVSDAYKKNLLSIQKLRSVGRAISYYETICNTEMRWCTYVTYNQVCSGGFIVEYSPDCTPPQYCQQGVWTLTDYDYHEVCEQVWFPDPPTDPGEGGGEDEVNPEDPREDYEFTYFGDSIRLADRFPCFENVLTNGSTTYSVKICADVAFVNTPMVLLHNGSPGHTFLELTKTNGTTSITQTIGFYPESSKMASTQFSVNSMMVDNQGHEYDASLIKMLNKQQFDSVLYAAMIGANNDYMMTGYNCTVFAMDVFNAAGYTITIPDTVSPMGPTVPFQWNYGKTPNALFLNLKDKSNNQYPGASGTTGYGMTSNCN